MGPLDILTDIATVYTIVQGARDLQKVLQRQGVLSEAQNAIADLRLKARGHIAPIIIERLDNGTHPEYQYLSIDMAPAFPQEHIDKALHYWSGQSVENVVNVLWAD